MKLFLKLVVYSFFGVLVYASSGHSFNSGKILDCSIATSKVTSCFPYPSKIYHVPPREFYRQITTPEAPSVVIDDKTFRDTNRTLNIIAEKPKTPPPPPNGNYMVQKGDTIGAIARKFSLTTQEIKQQNATIQTLRAGEMIVIPLSQETIDTISSGEYRVQSGDTLSHIAIRFNVDTRQIIRFNSLKSANSIRIGQVLQLPFPHRITFLEAREKEQNSLKIKEGTPYTTTRQLRVTATAYTSHADQTQGDPFVGAWNNKLTPGSKTIAVSRDLLSKYGLKNGSKVRISGLSGYYTVRDKMHSKYTKRIDIYMGLDRKGALKWGRRSVVIYW